MSQQIQRRRGSTLQHTIFTGAVGEITIDTDKKTVVVHDGITPGGFPLAHETNSNILGDAATKNVGTIAGTVAAGDHTHAGVYQPLSSSLTSLSAATTAGISLAVSADAASQRVALGLGDAATKNVGTIAGTVAPGDLIYDLISGMGFGWNWSSTGLDPTKPTSEIWSKGSTKFRAVYSYLNNAIQSTAYSFSNDNGATWTLKATVVYSYANGFITTTSWS